jgi:hypothetical protein
MHAVRMPSLLKISRFPARDAQIILGMRTSRPRIEKRLRLVPATG